MLTRINYAPFQMLMKSRPIFKLYTSLFSSRDYIVHHPSILNAQLTQCFKYDMDLWSVWKIFLMRFNRTYSLFFSLPSLSRVLISMISSWRFLFSLDFWILELKFISHIEIFRHTGLFKNWHILTQNNQLHQLKKLFLFWNVFSQFGFKIRRAPLKSMLLLPK